MVEAAKLLVFTVLIGSFHVSLGSRVRGEGTLGNRVFKVSRGLGMVLHAFNPSIREPEACLIYIWNSRQASAV